ncbi:PREDICTED: periostin [Nicrophorus vespilloides]|uniref:Periostin n=1 Tax=Nicrophorus vespilloides TaxID=110193 RepID=A0ABM1MIC8_NICVS|nr:PREDICTED: periostin [Nicrophorus vespilloides]
MLRFSVFAVLFVTATCNYGDHVHWNWNSDDFSGRSDESREPLSPDFQDPATLDSNPLPGGVVDIDANRPNFPFAPFNGQFGLGLGNTDGNQFLGIGGYFNFAPSQPWWKGENVCVERIETTDDDDNTDEGKKNTTEERSFVSTLTRYSCVSTDHKHECITKLNNHGSLKTLIVRYKCCHGYGKRYGSNGCNMKMDLKSLNETLVELKGNVFKDLLDDSDYYESSNYTIFMPNDDTIGSFEEEQNSVTHQPESKSIKGNDLAKSHIVKGLYNIHDLENEELLETEYQDTKIRINQYYGMTWANCIKVSKANNMGKNSIVHIIDEVMKPVTKSVTEIIENNPNLSSFWKMMESVNVTKYIREDGHYTIFAPTNEAFDKLKDKDMLVNGNACARNVLRHHMIRNTICSSFIIENATAVNLDGNNLLIQRSAWGLSLEKIAKIVKTDIMGTNGVIHLIDVVLIPENALYANEALKRNNYTKFQELIAKAGYDTEIDKATNITIFALSDETLAKPESKKILDEIKDDQDKLRAFIDYHIVDGKLTIDNLGNDVMLNTKLKDSSLRLNLYSTVSARVRLNSIESCSSVIHEVKRPLVPATKTILEILKDDGNYSHLLSIINGTEIEEILSDTNRSITLVAPDDSAFESIAKADMTTLLEDQQKAVQIMKDHILTEVLCCDGIGFPHLGFNSFVPTLGSSQQKISNNGNHIRIGSRGFVKKCDDLAVNGVVQTINAVLYPQRYSHATLGSYFFNL